MVKKKVFAISIFAFNLFITSISIDNILTNGILIVNKSQLFFKIYLFSS